MTMKPDAKTPGGLAGYVYLDQTEYHDEKETYKFHFYREKHSS
jgi:hypothetical protein